MFDSTLNKGIKSEDKNIKNSTTAGRTCMSSAAHVFCAAAHSAVHDKLHHDISPPSGAGDDVGSSSDIVRGFPFSSFFPSSRSNNDVFLLEKDLLFTFHVPFAQRARLNFPRALEAKAKIATWQQSVVRILDQTDTARWCPWSFLLSILLPLDEALHVMVGCVHHSPLAKAIQPVHNKETFPCALHRYSLQGCSRQSAPCRSHKCHHNES